MINLTVINIKDIFNVIKNIFIVFILVIILKKCSLNIKTEKIFNFYKIKEKIAFDYKIIDDNILVIKYLNAKDKNKESGIKKMLSAELSILEVEEKLMEKENQEEVVEFENRNENDSSKEQEYNSVEVDEIIAELDEEKIESSSNIPIINTKVLSENNIPERYTDILKNVKIKNESKYQLTEDIINPDKNFTKGNDIIIYHTHTCESYTPTKENNYEASGNFRTIDSRYNVVRVGTELENYLKNKGFLVKHDSTYHDYPKYTGSYSRALSTIKNLIQNSNAELVIDLHRDALGSNSNYAPRVQIENEVVSQLMFVIGTDGGGLEHSNWKENLKLAIKIQEKANEMYPGLFRPIILRDSRYNQHISNGACIIEVGATGNTLEECVGSMKYLSNVLEDVMK